MDYGTFRRQAVSLYYVSKDYSMNTFHVKTFCIDASISENKQFVSAQMGFIHNRQKTVSKLIKQ